MSLKLRGILVLVVGSVLGLSLSLGGTYVAAQKSPAAADRSLEQARRFAEVMERVKRDYVEPITDEQLLESAIRGMVSDLDVHSQYLDARHNLREQARLLQGQLFVAGRLPVCDPGAAE